MRQAPVRFPAPWNSLPALFVCLGITLGCGSEAVDRPSGSGRDAPAAADDAPVVTGGTDAAVLPTDALRGTDAAGPGADAGPGRRDAGTPIDARRPDAARPPDARPPADAQGSPDGALTCTPGYADCHPLVDGCEAYILTDTYNCGGCGNHCAGFCIQGQCECASSQTLCGSDCVYTSGDLTNCGRCGNECPSPVADGSPTCSQGQCAVWCNTHYGNCDDVVANGCETDLRKSEAHCGRCGMACAAGATCQGQACVARPRPTVFSLTQGSPVDLALDGSHVYWATSFGDLYAMPLSGGAPRVLASGFKPNRIAVDGTSLYWLDVPELGRDGTVNKVPLSGGPVAQLATTPSPVGLAVDASAVYWTNAGGLIKVGLDGGAQTVLAGASDAGALAQDATFLYVAAGRPWPSLLKVPKAGGLASTLLANASSVDTLAVDATNVYVGDSWITVVPLAGGPPRNLQNRDTTQLLAEGGSLYAMSRDFSIDTMMLRRFSTSVANDPGTVLAGFDFGGGVPNRMALGAADLFVADYLGYAIVRTPR